MQYAAFHEYQDFLENTDPLRLETNRLLVDIRSRLVRQRLESIEYQSAMGAALHNLASPLYKQGRYEECFQTLDEAIEIQKATVAAAPDYAAAKTYLRFHYSNLCLFLVDCPDHSLRDLPRAIELGKAALELEPDSSTPKFRLGMAYYRNDDPDKAKPLLLDVVNRNSDDPLRCFLLSATCAKLEQWKEAELWFDEGCKRFAKTPSASEDDQRWKDEAAQLLLQAPKT